MQPTPERSELQKSSRKYDVADVAMRCLVYLCHPLRHCAPPGRYDGLGYWILLACLAGKMVFQATSWSPPKKSCNARLLCPACAEVTQLRGKG